MLACSSADSGAGCGRVDGRDWRGGHKVVPREAPVSAMAVEGVVAGGLQERAEAEKTRKDN